MGIEAWPVEAPLWHQALAGIAPYSLKTVELSKSKDAQCCWDLSSVAVYCEDEGGVGLEATRLVIYQIVSKGHAGDVHSRVPPGNVDDATHPFLLSSPRQQGQLEHMDSSTCM